MARDTDDLAVPFAEFTSLDAEVGYLESAEELRSIVERVVVQAIDHVRTELAETGNPLAGRIPEAARPFPRIPFALCEEWLGHPGAEEELGTEDEKAVGVRAEQEYGSAFYFVTDFPTAVKAQTFYAMRQDADPRRTYYCDLYFSGLELMSGGLREHRLDRLLANLRAAGLSPDAFQGYLEAFRFGMPPHGGWAIGIDRLVQALAGLPNIREARLFPRDRYRLDP